MPRHFNIYNLQSLVSNKLKPIGLANNNWVIPHSVEISRICQVIFLSIYKKKKRIHETYCFIMYLLLLDQRDIKFYIRLSNRLFFHSIFASVPKFNLALVKCFEILTNFTFVIHDLCPFMEYMLSINKKKLRSYNFGLWSF